MVGGFFDEADDDFHSMHRAFLQGYTDEVRRVAHRLKNTVVYLGARPAMDAIVEVESAAKSGEISALDQALVKLERQLEDLKSSLIAYHRQNITSSKRPG